MTDEGTVGPIRVMLVDDHVSFRQALAFIFSQDERFVVAAQAASLAEAREALEGVDVAIVDLGLPDGNGTSLFEDLRRRNPGVIVLVLSASLDPENFEKAVEAGAAGVLDKLASIDDITDATLRLRAGEALISQEEVIEMLRLARQRGIRTRPHPAVSRLTHHEREMLRALGEGLGSKGIAGRLSMTVEEEQTQMEEVLGKLGVHSRLQALLLAVRHGIVEVS